MGGTYHLLGPQLIGFSVAAYDRLHPLVIDPTVSFVTTFGSVISERVEAVAVDSSGNSYVTGATDNEHFPVTNNSKWLNADCGSFFPPTFCATGYNSFVAKLSPTGTLLFATYSGVGGGSAIAVDSTGVYVTGTELKPDIDNIIGYAGGSDIFVLKLSPSGSVIYKNIFGTTKDDDGNAIAVDSQHNAWIAGSSWGYRSAPLVDVIKVGPTGLFISEARYTAGGDSIAYGIAIDPADQAWITGKACGGGFPVTNGSDSTSLCKAFVVQLERTATFMVTRMSMVFGGSDAGDIGYAVLPNGSNSAYITGVTYAPNFPTTLGAYQPIKLSGGPSAFVTQVDSASFTGRIVHSTLLGSSVDTTGTSIASIDAGAVYIGGYTSSSGFIQKLKYDLSQSNYTKTLFSHVYGLAALKPATASGIPEIYAGGDNTSYGIVAKLDDDVVQSQVLWHNTATGQLTAWTLDAQGLVTSTQPLSAQCAASSGCSQSWKVIGTIDSNRDGVGDVLFYNATSGEVQVWLLDTMGTVTGTQSLSRNCGTSDGCSQAWKPVTIGDFNHDGNQDVLWHNDVTGQLQAWLLDGARVTNTLTFAQVCRVSEGCWPRWQILAAGDFNSDGIDDLFWYDTATGKIDVGILDGNGRQKGAQWLANVCGPSNGCSNTWKPAGLADVNQDGTGDLLWENVTTGEISAWLLNGTDRLLGTRSLSLRCDSASGCPAGSLPVGILRNRAITP
ncbi:MAG: FG-GAP-like repeat-containing protein [Bryobacteraceae bacterium]